MLDVSSANHHNGPTVSCNNRRCRGWNHVQGVWVGARAVVNNPEKYGVKVEP